MNDRSIRWAAVFLALAGMAFAQNQSAADRDWQLFRKAYPYHIQAIALSSEHADHSRTLIVSEPPPHATLEGLGNLEPAVFANPLTRTVQIGYDGWVRDVVVRIDYTSDREIRTLIDRLHIYLFGSAYKSYALSIPSEGAPPRARRDLNIHISAADLDRWLFRSNGRFIPYNGAAAVPVATLLATGKSGLYYSEEPGVVALVTPKSPLSIVRRQLRQFALDTDLILGATSYRSRVAIFARERTVPVDLLPPLRTETILQLASAAPRLTELSQSYERNNFFAGHMDQLGWDWAPVYLSDILIDSEYGSLLNITDQLLKSWSSNGEVEYYRFPYPAPPRWPFAAPIILDAKVQEVTFNWNTRGAGYAIDFPDASGFRRIFSLNRTGALPVNYIPSQVGSSGDNPLARYELTGYEYFAGLSDPNLVRVVQYASLYQIFHEFGVADDSASTASLAHPEWGYLGGIGVKVVNFLLSEKADTMVTTLRAALRAEAAQDLQQLRRRLVEAKAAFGDGIVSEIGLRLANPRLDNPLERTLAAGERSRSSLTPAELRAITATRLARLVHENPVGRKISDIVGGSDKIYRKYVESARDRKSGWIRTASVVVSRTTGSMAQNYFGGHNLDPNIIHYRVSTALKAGESRLVEDGTARIVLISPSDVDRISGVARKAALANGSREVPSVLSRELPKLAPLPLRTRAIALQVDPRQFTAERGMATAAADQRLALHTGWSAIPKSAATLPHLPAESQSLGARAIAVEKLPDFSFRVYLPGIDTPRAATSYDAALDTVMDAMKNVDGPAGAWKLHLSGFDRTEARNFVRTTEVQFTARENLQLAGFTSESKLSSPELMKTLSEHYDFRRATVLKVEVETVPGLGRAESEALRFDIEIPSLHTTRPSLIMRIRIFFRGRILEPVRLAVESAVNRILNARPAVGTMKPGIARDTEKILLDLKRDLKNMRIPGAPDLDFEIDVSTGAGDFYVTENCSGREAAAA